MKQAYTMWMKYQTNLIKSDYEITATASTIYPSEDYMVYTIEYKSIELFENRCLIGRLSWYESNKICTSKY